MRFGCSCSPSLRHPCLQRVEKHLSLDGCSRSCLMVPLSIYLTIYVCVCMCIYIYILCQNTYIHTYIHACMHACIHTYIHIAYSATVDPLTVKKHCDNRDDPDNRQTRRPRRPGPPRGEQEETTRRPPRNGRETTRRPPSCTEEPTRRSPGLSRKKMPYSKHCFIRQHVGNPAQSFPVLAAPGSRPECFPLVLALFSNTALRLAPSGTQKYNQNPFPLLRLRF